MGPVRANIPAMRAWLAALVLLSLVACGEGGDGVDAGSDEPAALAGITAAHNAVRDGVGVGPLVWDPALAAIAQEWAEACVDNDAPAGLIDHNPGRSDDYPGYVGENIYASTGTVSPTAAVAAWASEDVDYDYDSNSCAPGKVCGHYTQLVWADTTRVGCGVAACASLTYTNGLVCDYSPGGNIVGQRPY